ncbi:MAG: transcriptional regulator [Gammaproteobacteria bacterium]|nr:MAG: transcriptional regulator [Gammaproteobacteria bacterium]
MPKPLKQLLKKVDPAVVNGARVKADRFLLELQLARLREESQLSQQEIADILGISQPSVANLEKRGEEVKLSTLKRYVEALGGKLTLDIEFTDGRHIGINV